ncbi:30S ribosomal protein S17 [Oceanococcus atlanticus]|uniref:Small ribosomal subunit protein uS17 n=1 Tax=Oceanococcus atlanticus TaxID=1317117 RepID=A0A1Y1SH21_9GAMM|nr:30S ribosomal protein S17 [Oceanococcus atlanticus]ORE88972.1 30S ribosomal protein S17 [Oceanococcus atlanticus]RZO83150.1 MAG: 30S ribosomal protein S17 [Oceanococcus sp.]
MSQSEKGAPRLMGTVTSNKMDKTITVLVEHREKHALYGKYISRSHKVHAHDESNDCQIGDRVTVVQCRPLSKSKTWKLVEIVERAGLE